MLICIIFIIIYIYFIEQCTKMPHRYIVHFEFKKYIITCCDASSQLNFTEQHILPLYKLIHNILCLIMYTLAKALLPDVMNELNTTNDQMHE